MADTIDDEWGELLGDVSGPVPLGKPRTPVPTVVSRPIPPAAMARVGLVKRLKRVERTPAGGTSKRTQSVHAATDAAVPTPVDAREDQPSAHTRRFSVPLPPKAGGARRGTGSRPPGKASLADEALPITLEEGVPVALPAMPSWQESEDDSAPVERISAASDELRVRELTAATLDAEHGPGNGIVASEASDAMSLGPLVARGFAPVTVPHRAVPQSVLPEDVDPDPDSERIPVEPHAASSGAGITTDAVADVRPLGAGFVAGAATSDADAEIRPKPRAFASHLAAAEVSPSSSGSLPSWVWGGAAIVAVAAVLWLGLSGGDDAQVAAAPEAAEERAKPEPATTPKPAPSVDTATDPTTADPPAGDVPTGDAPDSDTPSAAPTPPAAPAPVAPPALPADASAYEAALAAVADNETPATLEALALAACSIEDGVKARSAFRKLRGSDYRSRVIIACRKVDIDVTAKGDGPTGAELVRQAKRALAAGDHKAALRLARGANRLETSAAARLVMALAACAGGDLERATALHRHVARGDRKEFAARCPAVAAAQ